jgi:pyruvate kinase
MGFLSAAQRPPQGHLHLVVTLGPGSRTLAGALAGAGATSFRVNGSHLSAGELSSWLEALRAQVPGVPVVVDLQGAKMRLGAVEPRTLRSGERVRLAVAPGAGVDLPVPHPELFRSLRPGETAACDDGRLSFRVELVGEGHAEATCLVGGLVRPRKGVNVVEHPVALDGLSLPDREQVAAARGWGGVDFAVSFMEDGREAAWVRDLAPGAAVVGKVERREALASLDGILARVDAAWVCRGDLGVQVGEGELARFVSSWRPPAAGVPVLMAGQVLEHLTAHAEPTRSEVCHLHDVLARGYAGIVLSDETAVGADPVRAVATARRLLDSLG